MAAAATADMSLYVTGRLGILTDMLRQMVAPIALAMFVLAGAVYSAGQVFDKATREKAEAWSKSVVLGAAIGVLIVVLAPFAVSLLTLMGGI